MPAAYDLSSSTALVTGAAGDIGRAAALRLAHTGARVALTDLPDQSDQLEEVRSRCAAIGGAGSLLTVTADVADPESVEACFGAVVDQFDSPPDLVFNNAGYQGLFAPAVDYDTADFSKVMKVNVEGVFNVLRECSTRLRAAGLAGSIVNSASMAGVDGAPNMIAYSASKGAVISMTRSAAKDLAPLGIRVNAISPAFIGPGAMWDRQVALQADAGSQYYSSDPVEVARDMINQVPIRRYGAIDEVVAVVVWLLSDEASYITGENIRVAGGI